MGNREDIIKAAAPILYLHPTEDNLPSAIEWYLDRVTLINVDSTSRKIFDNTQSVIEAVGAAGGLVGYAIAHGGTEEAREVYDEKNRLAGPPVRIADLPLADQPGAATDKDYRLNDGKKPDIRAGNANGAPWPCYVNVIPQPDANATEIQYWLFYPYNGALSQWDQLPVGDHTGDWEFVAARVKGADIDKVKVKDLTVRHLFLSCHGGSESLWFPIEAFARDPETGRPIVYPAKHSHGNYTTIGKHKRFFGNDYTDKGRPWRIWEQYVEITWNSGTKVAGGKKNDWVRFPGLWGQKDNGITDSPQGPAFHGSFYRVGTPTLALIYKSNSGDDLYVAMLPSSGDKKTGGKTKSAPAIAAFRSSLFAVYRSSRDDGLWWARSDDGGRNWAKDARVPDASSDTAPAVAAGTGVGHCAYKPKDGSLWMQGLSVAQGKWSKPKQILDKGNVKGAPSLAGSKGALVCAYLGKDGNLNLLTRLPDGTWSKPASISKGAPADGDFAIAFFGNRLWCVFRKKDKTLWSSSRSLNKGAWTSAKAIVGQTSSTRPALAAGPKALWCVYKSSNTDNIYFTGTKDGKKWAAGYENDKLIAAVEIDKIRTDYSPAACFNTYYSEEY